MSWTVMGIIVAGVIFVAEWILCGLWAMRLDFEYFRCTYLSYSSHPTMWGNNERLVEGVGKVVLSFVLLGPLIMVVELHDQKLRARRKKRRGR